MWNPEDYAKHSEAQLKWARELRETLNLEGNEAILDVAAGTGKLRLILLPLYLMAA